MIEGRTKIILASASPRRAEILRGLGLQFEVEPVDVDESIHPGETPREYADRLAIEKAEACRAKHPDALVIGADTVVAVQKAILGKPADRVEAERMLLLLNGGLNRVITSIAVAGNHVEVRSAETSVVFREMTSEEINWYLDTGEPFDKAGGYGIQGLASLFVEEIEGSHANVVGLPVHLLPELFEKHGINFFSLLNVKVPQV